MESSSGALPYRSSSRTAPGGYTSSTTLASRPYTYTSPGSALNQSEDPVVIEIGTRYLRAGFANESAPRCEIPYTEELWRRVGDRVVDSGQRRGTMLPQRPGAVVEERVIKRKSTRRTRGELWQYDLRTMDTGLVEDVVERVVREAYNKYLLVDSKTKKVVLPLPPLLPNYLVKAITNTLFKHFQPPTIAFFSAPVLCTVSAGLRSALVVDIGWHETVITPIYELRAISGLVGACGRSKRAGKLLRKKTGQALENLLAEKGIEGTKIREDFLEDLVARVLWCENYTMHKKEKEEQQRFQSLKASSASSPTQPTPPITKPVFSTAGSATMLIPIATVDSHKPLSINIPLSTLSLPVETAFFGATSYSQSSYFDDEDEPDEDDLSIPHLIYKSLLECPIDVRATCLSRIVIVGGPSHIPGLKMRLVDELRAMVEEKGGWSNIKPSKKLPPARRKQPPPAEEAPPSPLPPATPIINTAAADDDTATSPRTIPAAPAEPALSATSSIPPTPSAALSEIEDPMENLELFTNRDRSRKYLELEEKESLKPKYPPGLIRGVQSLGAWAGGSILAGARVKGILEVDREKFLANVAAGGMGFPTNVL